MMRAMLSLFAAVTAAISDACAAEMEEPQIHTYSIVAFDERTGELGVAVQSKYFAVGAVVPWAKAGVGAIATQALGRVSFGAEGLRMLGDGKSAKETLDALVAGDKRPAVRQVGIVDAKGNVAVHTGEECRPWAGHRAGRHYSVQGNLLTGAEVIDAMAAAFEKSREAGEGELADWLLAAMKAGQAAGGDRRGQQSAALLVVREGGGPGGDNDRAVDLRVDDDTAPIEELGRLLELHKEFYRRKQR